MIKQKGFTQFAMNTIREGSLEEPANEKEELCCNLKLTDSNQTSGLNQKFPLLSSFPKLNTHYFVKDPILRT